MLAPTPMLRPSPMDLTGLFAGTLNALKQRAALLILIWLVPTLLTVVAVVAGGVALFAEIGAAIAGSRSLWSSAARPVAGMVAAVMVIALADAKAAGMTALAAYEIAQGQRPTFRGVWTRSRGFLLRMMPVVVLLVAAVVLFMGLIAGIAAMAISALSERSGARVLGAFGLLFLLVNAEAPVSWWLRVKLLYTVPAVVIEQTGGIAGMRRSWALTRGAFWRTLGSYLVGSLAIGMVASPVAVLGQLPLVAIRFPDNYDDLPQAWATLSMSLPLVLVAVGVQLLMMAITEPLMQAYTTYLFIDQVRRSELPESPAPQRPHPQAGSYPTPAPHWGPPGPAYPPASVNPPQPGPRNDISGPAGPTPSGWHLPS